MNKTLARVARRRLAVVAMTMYAAVTLPLMASTHLVPEKVCDQVAQIVSQETGVPISVLQAITRTETGRKKNGKFGPWPWTVNMEGKGVWFDTLDEARAYVFRHFKRGARSFDVGCFQINYKWHHQAFASIDEMFDPMANATYAAEFLTKLFAEHSSWTDAAGAYHSRTPKYANRYKAIFEKHRGKTPDHRELVVASAPVPSKAAVPINRYPLLQSGGGTQLGSLVPLINRGGSSWFLNLDRPVGG